MGVLGAQTIVKEGLVPVFDSPEAGGDVFFNNGLYILVVRNTSGTSKTITLASAENCSQGVNHPLVVTVGAGETVYISNLAQERFNDQNDRVSISYSAVDGLEVAVLKII